MNGSRPGHQEPGQHDAEAIPGRAGQQPRVEMGQRKHVHGRAVDGQRPRGLRDAEGLARHQPGRDGGGQHHHGSRQPDVDQLGPRPDAVQHQHRRGHGGQQDQQLGQRLPQRHRDQQAHCHREQQGQLPRVGDGHRQTEQDHGHALGPPGIAGGEHRQRHRQRRGHQDPGVGRRNRTARGDDARACSTPHSNSTAAYMPNRPSSCSSCCPSVAPAYSVTYSCMQQLDIFGGQRHMAAGQRLARRVLPSHRPARSSC